MLAEVRETEALFTQQTGREIPNQILLVEGNPCDYPDQFERRFREMRRDLRRAKELLGDD